MNRREFIFGTVATSALAGCSTVRTGLRPLAPGEKRKIAMIGCGIQMRKALIPQFLNPEYNATMRIAVTCDCDRVRAAAAASRCAISATCAIAMTATSSGIRRKWTSPTETPGGCRSLVRAIGTDLM